MTNLLPLIIGNFSGLPIRKKPRTDIAQYEAWVRNRNCAVCGTNANITFSHTKKKKRCGNHAGSIFGIAKCMTCHILYDQKMNDYDVFSAWLLTKYGTTIPQLIVQTWQAWLREHNVSWSFALGMDHIEFLSVQEFADQAVESLEQVIIEFYKG